MKTVEWTTENGYERRALIRDEDPVQLAYGGGGLAIGPPDLEQLDWDAIKRELHNTLVSRGLNSWAEVQRSQNGITSAITAVLRRRIINLYRQQEVLNADNQ